MCVTFHNKNASVCAHFQLAHFAYLHRFVNLEADAGVEGHGLAFTLSHGTELCVSALQEIHG
jgi:hypothetical protein